MKKLLVLSLVAAMVVTVMTGCGSASDQNTSAETEAVAEESAATGEEAASAGEESTDNTENAADGKTFKIGVIQLVEHAALDASNEGFVAALNDAGISYEIDQQNAQNVSGTSDLTPVKEQIELLTKLLPEAKTVGILYSSAESNSVLQAEMAKEACADAGLASEVFTVSSSNEIQQVVESMVGKVDVIYTPTDNTIAAGMATVTMVANENGLPTICGEEGMVEAGGLATYGIDYYEIGYMAGQQAVDILVNGADITTMPIGYLSADQCTLTTNQETADVLGVDLTVLD